MMKKTFKTAVITLGITMASGFAQAQTSGLNSAAYIPPLLSPNNTIGFAGRQWFVVGTPVSGVTSPGGTVMLLESRVGVSGNEGTTMYRSYLGGGNYAGTYSNPADYNTSTLMQKISDIAASLTAKERSFIVNRHLNGISGAAVNNQALWALSKTEFDALLGAMPDMNTSLQILSYGSAGQRWWLRSQAGNPGDPFVYEADPGT